MLNTTSFSTELIDLTENIIHNAAKCFPALKKVSSTSLCRKRCVNTFRQHYAVTGFKLLTDVGGEQQEERNCCFHSLLPQQSVLLCVSCSCPVEFAANGCKSKAAEKAAGWISGELQQALFFKPRPEDPTYFKKILFFVTKPRKSSI